MEADSSNEAFSKIEIKSAQEKSETDRNYSQTKTPVGSSSPFQDIISDQSPSGIRNPAEVNVSNSILEAH